MGLIYWIASYPRSGNTWTRAVLTSLISGGLAGDLDKLQRYVPDENNGRFYTPYLHTPLEVASKDELARIRPLAHRDMAMSVPNFLLLKTHSMVAMHRGTHTITPEVTAGAVYLLRNPLDVAVSASAFRTRSIDEAIRMMNEKGHELDRPTRGGCELSGSWSENVSSWTTPSPRVLVTRYEDLLDDPVAGFSRIATFLRMRASDADIRRAVEETSFENLKAAEAAGGFKQRPKEAEPYFRLGKSGGWRNELSEEQVAEIVSANHRQMKRFGYWLDEFDALVRRSDRPGGAAESDVTAE